MANSDSKHKRLPIWPSGLLSISLSVFFLIALITGCRSKSKQSIESAEEAWRSGDCAKAAQEYESYLAKRPPVVEAAKVNFDLANVYGLCKREDQRDLVKAQEHYKLAAQQTTDAAFAITARQRIAEIYVDTNHRYDAISEYESLLQRYPDTALRRTIRLAIANLYNDLNNYSQAETEYNKVIDAASYDQLSENAYLRISNINTLREHYDQAIPALEKIIANSSDPHSQNSARFALSEIYVKQFQYDKALEQLRQVRNPTVTETDFIKRRIEQIEKDRKKHAASPAEMEWSN